MIEIIFIEILSLVSYLYSLFMLVMPFTSIDNMFVIFIWTILSSIIYACLCKKHKLFNLSLLLLFVPLIYFRDTQAVIFIFSTSIILLLYIRNSLLKGNYHVHKDQIKRSYLLYIPLIYFKIVMDNFDMTIGEAIPFIIIYIFSSIISLRTIRHLDSNMGIKTIRRNNIRNILIISFILPVIFFQNLRDIVGKMLDKIVDIIYYPVQMLGQIIGFFVEKFFGLANEGLPQEIVEEEMEEVLTGPLEEMGDMVSRQAFDYTIIKNIFIIILLILFIYIVYRTIIRSGKSTFEEIDYLEEREYIKDNKKKKKIFKRDKFPEEFSGQIRYYYRKFLKKIEKKGVEIEKTDSSLQINEKAKPVFQVNLSRIRELYINSRYSKSKVDEGDVKEMEELYKNL